MKELSDICFKMDQSGNFVNLQLNIVETLNEENYYTYLAKGLYKGEEVGLKVSLKKGIPMGIDLQTFNFANAFTKEGIKLQTIGATSDRLLNAMSILYKVYKEVNFRSDLDAFLCANLNDYPIDYSKGEYRFKIFMDRGDLNAELFVNFDFDRKLIHLDEKDINYRKDIIRFLSEEFYG